MGESVKGIVIRGKGRGAALGFPSANLDTPATLLPKEGVYAGIVMFDGHEHMAAISCGPAYTFGEKDPILEAHLLDFDGDLYGKELTVEIVCRIRHMEKFDTPQELVWRITQDCQAVMKILKNGAYVQWDHQATRQD